MIRVEGIAKSYNGEPCLRGVSLHVEKGEFVSVMGESGSGKTTLMEILAGVRVPDSGKVEVDGVDVLSLNEKDLAKFRRTKMGVVYQQFGLVSTLSARDNIRLPLLLEKLGKRETDERVEAVAKALKIDAFLDKYPNQLSGGQQQRVAIARAVVYRPRVLFLDEATGSLDSENTENILQFLTELNKKEGTTVFQITHSDRAARAGNRVIKIRDGVIE